MASWPSDCVAALLEDFRAHWQALMQTEAEISRWSTVYAGALVLGAATVFTQDPASKFNETVPSLALLVFALVNAVYILALAFKGYQCQQLRLYLHEVIGSRLRALTDDCFNSYEQWHRCEFCPPGKPGKPEPIRAAYYGLQVVLPFLVSIVMVAVFWAYRIRWSPEVWEVAALALVIAANCVSAVYALQTISIAKRWHPIASRRSGSSKESVAQEEVAG